MLITKSESWTCFEILLKVQGFDLRVKGSIKDKSKRTKISRLWNRSFFVAFDPVFQIGWITYVVGAITKHEDINVVHTRSIYERVPLRQGYVGHPSHLTTTALCFFRWPCHPKLIVPTMSEGWRCRVVNSGPRVYTDNVYKRSPFKTVRTKNGQKIQTGSTYFSPKPAGQLIPDVSTVFLPCAIHRERHTQDSLRQQAEA